MALTDKDFEKMRDALKESNVEVRDFYDELKDVFDISKQINNQYNKIHKELRKNTDELKISREAVIGYKKDLESVDSQIQTNLEEIVKLETHKQDIAADILSVEQSLEEMQNAKTENIAKEAMLTEEINKIQERILKNKGAIIVNEKAQGEILKQREAGEKRIEIVRKKMGELNSLSNAGNLEAQKKYNDLLISESSLEEYINGLKKKGYEYADAEEALKAREQRLEHELWRKGMDIKDVRTEIKDLDDEILRAAIEHVELTELQNDVEHQIKNSYKTKTDLAGKKYNLEKNISKEIVKQKELSEKINELQAQLNFWKLIQMGYERFVKLDEAAEKFRRETGFSNTQMVELRKNAESVNIELQEFGVGIEQAYSAAKALTDVFGTTSLVTKEAMANVALMSANLNVAVEDSAAVLATFQGLGGATQEAAMNMMKIGAGLSEKAGVPFSLVMKDIANASDQTLSMLSANPSKLMKASIAARALGTDMNKLVSSQRKLLDYSTSMNEELELSALLGKSVSFQLSRQLAYEGDIAGAAKATLETVKAAGDFDKMSVYQREALAKASGMELKDLTKMMAVDKQKEEIRLRGTDEQKRQLAIQEETLKKLEEENDLSKQGLLADGERAIRQQKMQGLMTKMKNILEAITLAAADVLEPIITPLVKILIPAFKLLSFTAKLLSPIIKGMVYPIQLVAEWISKWTDGITESMDGAKGFKDFFENAIVKWALGTGGVLSLLFFGKTGFGKIMDMVKAPFKMVKDVGKNMLGKLTGKGAASDFIGPKLPDASAAGDGVGKAAKATKDVKSGTGVKDFLTNLAAGLKEMGSVKVLFGAFNLIPASIGLIAMIPGFFGAKLLEQIDGKSLKSAMSGLAEGLEKMGTGSVAKGSLVMILAGVGFAAMTIGAIGLGAVALLGTAAGTGLVGLSVGLAALGTVGGIGALVLMGISAAFIGFAYAGKLAAEAFISIVEVIPDAIGPLIKFALISPLLYAAAGGIGALSWALGVFAGASVGGKLVSFFTGNPFDKFQKIADMSESLSMSAAAIKEISIAASSFTAVDEFSKSVGRLAESLGKLNDQLGKIKSEELSKLSQISSAAGTTSTESKSMKVDNSGVEAKLDKLTDLLVGGAVRVYIDGTDVSSAIARV